MNPRYLKKYIRGFISSLALCLIISPCFAESEKQDPWTASYALEAQGQYQQAAELISPLKNRALASEFSWLRTAWLLYLQTNYSASIEAYQTAIHINSNSHDALLGITLPLMAQQRWREAAQYADQVIERSEWNYTAQIRMLMCESALKQWQDVKKRAQELTMRYPTETMPWLYLARAENWLGNTEQAINAYKQVLMRSPANLEANMFVIDEG